MWDSVVARLEYQNNTLLTIVVIRNGNKVYENTVVVVTSDSQILETGRNPEALTETFMARHAENFRKELPHFAQLVRKGNVQNDATGSVLTSVLIEAATKSATNNGERIVLN